MKPFEITDNIFIIGGPEITDARDSCVYMLALGELILIDTGAGWSFNKIINNIKMLKFNPENIRKIILTHCHIDHIGGVPEFKKRFKANIYIHKLDSIALEKGDQILTAANFYQTIFPPTPVDYKITGPKEIFIINQQEIVCLHTPGHTPGSISIYLERNRKRILFAQDLHGPLLEEFGSNLKDWDTSTKRLLELEADILCEGHFGIYKTKKAVKEYILSYRRHFGVT